MVRAKCESNDKRAQATFDATPFLRGATRQAIHELAACSWGGGFPAENVAYHAAEASEDVRFVLRYATEAHGIGFECHVDGAGALEWMAEHRPGDMPPGGADGLR